VRSRNEGCICLCVFTRERPVEIKGKLKKIGIGNWASRESQSYAEETEIQLRMGLFRRNSKIYRFVTSTMKGNVICAYIGYSNSVVQK
jgi:hypothetical protein